MSLEQVAAGKFDLDRYVRNLIGGKWVFPTVPYDFDIRSPEDTRVIATVPLSSRYDVQAALNSAGQAAEGWATGSDRRAALATLIEGLRSTAYEIACLQAAETGLDVDGSAEAVHTAIAVAEEAVADILANPAESTPGISAHVLSWGLPFTEAVTSVLPALAAGRTVVFKPSLRAPLSPAAFADVADRAGLPAGVLNMVQGTGSDVGQDLFGRPGLGALEVRASPRTISSAERAVTRSGVPLRTLRAGGNIAVVGPDAGPQTAGLVESIIGGVLLHSAGGPFGLNLLAVHRDCAGALEEALSERLATATASPLPNETMCRRALSRVENLVEQGARIVCGTTSFDLDDVHKVGWRLVPTVLDLGPGGSPSSAAEQASEPFGPVLSLMTWAEPADLGAALTAPRAACGTARVWGAGADLAAVLPQALILGESDAPAGIAWTLPRVWTGRPG